MAKDNPCQGSTTSGGRWLDLRFPYPSFIFWVIFTLEILLCIPIVGICFRITAHDCPAIVTKDGRLARARGGDSNTHAPFVDHSWDVPSRNTTRTGEYRLFRTENVLQTLPQWPGRVSALPNFHKHENLRRHLERISPRHHSPSVCFERLGC